jgi:hypothetical protein
MSRYGMRRGRTSGQMRMHAGLDIGAPRGAQVFAPRPGTVALVARDANGRGSGLFGYGNAVVIHHHDENRYSFYAHLDRALVELGQFVSVGQPIGVVGATTNGKFPGMGRHLHMELRRPKDDGSSPFPGRYGRWNVDPLPWLAEHGIGFDREGLTADPAREACLSPIPGSRQLEWLTQEGDYRSPSPRSSPSLFTRGVQGLGGEEDPNADYEPVVPDDDFYKPLKPLIKALPLVLLGTIGLVGISVSLR